MLDRELSRLYALALVAIARADGEIGPDEGVRLQERIAARCQGTLLLEDLLLDSIQPADLAAAIQAGPFRGSNMPADQLGEMLLNDGLAVVLAKGHATNGEAHAILRFIRVLGCADEVVGALSGKLARWLPDEHP